MTTRLIRLDDYPYGTPYYGGHTREWCLRQLKDILYALNKYNTRYILGIPLLNLTDEDIGFLNGIVRFPGAIVMHGFTHGFDRWETVPDRWAEGGEFWDRSEAELTELYAQTSAMGTRLWNFNAAHFITPFNVYNEEIVRVLERAGVKFLHTGRAQYEKYGLDKIQTSMEVVITESKVTCGYIPEILKNLQRPEQITLHWAHDAGNYENCTALYEELGARVRDTR